VIGLSLSIHHPLAKRQHVNSMLTYTGTDAHGPATCVAAEVDLNTSVTEAAEGLGDVLRAALEAVIERLEL
jgi:hypothetical protein